ncbi:hypothetical protein C8T65DRAFT_667579 [Cerioporus squamosus]|nr:hypothetical protein C8T65DRAFT_667579 [Cerioporus squamosus]
MSMPFIGAAVCQLRLRALRRTLWVLRKTVRSHDCGDARYSIKYRPEPLESTYYKDGSGLVQSRQGPSHSLAGTARAFRNIWQSSAERTKGVVKAHDRDPRRSPAECPRACPTLEAFDPSPHISNTGQYCRSREGEPDEPHSSGYSGYTETKNAVDAWTDGVVDTNHLGDAVRLILSSEGSSNRCLGGAQQRATLTLQHRSWSRAGRIPEVHVAIANGAENFMSLPVLYSLSTGGSLSWSLGIVHDQCAGTRDLDQHETPW